MTNSQLLKINSTQDIQSPLKDLLAAIVQSSYDAIFFCSLDGIIKYWNEGAEKIFGYSSEEIVGKSINILAPHQVNDHAELLRKYNKGEKLKHYEAKRVTKGGSEIDIALTVTPVYNEKNILVGFSNIATDITKEKIERKKSEEKFRGFIESAPDGIVFVNREGKIQLVNSQTEKLFGYKREELIGKEVEILIPDRFKHVHPGHRKDYFAAPKPRHMGSGLSLYGLHKDGKEFPVDISLGYFETEEGLLVSASIRDITEMKLAEQNLKLKSEELARSIKDMEQFAYATSHDLQEPLRTISNYVELLEETFPETKDTETKQYFEFITSASSRMQNLIKDLMNFSRVEKDIAFEMVDCNSVLKEVIADLEAAINESKAKIKVAKLPVLNGNYSRLKQVFQNLIDNGIKFRRKNVTPVIEVNVEDKGNEYLFSVKDNGIGIEEQNYKKLFNIFQRLNPAEEYPGTGIGLSTVKKIVNLHNGQICVESRFNEGSIFYFTIPKENINKS